MNHTQFKRLENSAMLLAFGIEHGFTIYANGIPGSDTNQLFLFALFEFIFWGLILLGFVVARLEIIDEKKLK